MEMLRFGLQGKTAFFKKPEVNAYCYFTYSHIHKVVLLGILGAILGLDGYAQMKHRQKNKPLEEGFPEFYEKLKELQISIIPNNKNGYIAKKIQTFTNSVGYASQEQSGNLIIKEQWLDNPSWDICILLNNQYANDLADRIIHAKCEYIPYLGKNDHIADISKAKVFELYVNTEKQLRLNCLFPSDIGEIMERDFDDIDIPSQYLYRENLPMQLHPITNQYILKQFIYTDEIITNINVPVYKSDNQNFVFY